MGDQSFVDLFDERAHQAVLDQRFRPTRPWRSPGGFNRPEDLAKQTVHRLLAVAAARSMLHFRFTIEYLRNNTNLMSMNSPTTGELYVH